MLIAGFPSDATATNCWVVAPAEGEQCVVIDPGIGVAAQLDEIVAEHRLHPVAVLLTHGHFDHTFSVLPVCQARDVPAFIHPDDRGQLSDPWSGVGIPVGTPLFGTLTFAEPDDVRTLSDGDNVSLAGLDFGVRHAPGHSPGSVVFGLSEPSGDSDVLFSGDLLFAGSIGRVDLPGGSMAAMESSLRTVVLADGRRHGRAPRPRTLDDHRPRARHQPVSLQPSAASPDPTPVPRSPHDHSLSGFPELLPAQRAVELTVLDRLRATFELHGFASIETRAVEPLDELLRKGEIDKEVYVLRRLHAAEDAEDSGLGLHYDLTVPFARYVLDNAGHLEFPLRRYQIQKVWRGERPQEGRYREFTQADIDVVARDSCRSTTTSRWPG